MYEKYTRQSLPSKYYRELLGTAICVFNSNTQFVIENILHSKSTLSWYQLTDQVAGKTLEVLKQNLLPEDSDIAQLFEELIGMRNRIVHGFQITDKDGEQRLATKTRAPNNIQSVITEDVLLLFIQKNEKLSDLLYRLRDKIKDNIIV